MFCLAGCRIALPQARTACLYSLTIPVASPSVPVLGVRHINFAILANETDAVNRKNAEKANTADDLQSLSVTQPLWNVFFSETKDLRCKVCNYSS